MDDLFIFIIALVGLLAVAFAVEWATRDNDKERR